MTLSQNKKHKMGDGHNMLKVMYPISTYIHLYPDVSLAHVHPGPLWKTNSDDGESNDPLKWWLKTF